MISSVTSSAGALFQTSDPSLADARGNRNAFGATASGAPAGADPVAGSDQDADTIIPGAERELSAQATDNESTEASADGLTDEERAIVAELQQTDREVRAHEQAHLAAAGGLARGVSFTFVTGPDGKQYAVGGEVSIDTSPVSGDPQATIQKAQQIRAAANAPANPSGQDRAVAAQASAMEQAARQELAAEDRAELEEQRRAQLAQQNGQTQAEAITQPSTSNQIGQLLSLIA